MNIAEFQNNNSEIALQKQMSIYIHTIIYKNASCLITKYICKKFEPPHKFFQINIEINI